MKFVVPFSIMIAIAGCAGASKTEAPAAATAAKSFPKCEKALAKLQKEKPPKEETASNMITQKVEPVPPTGKDGKPAPGCALITYEITKEGLAENFRVLEKSDEAASKAALEALFKWKFRKVEAKNQYKYFVF